MVLALFLKYYTYIYGASLVFYTAIVLETATGVGTGVDPNVFDPATAKLGGVALLTIHMGIMAQLKKFFLIDPKKKYFDFLNYPVAFLLMVPVLPPWPPYAFGSWANYVAGGIGLAVLASVTAQKVRDPVSDGDQQEAAVINTTQQQQRIDAATPADAETPPLTTPPVFPAPELDPEPDEPPPDPLPERSTEYQEQLDEEQT